MRRTRTIAIIAILVIAFAGLVARRVNERRAEKAKLEAIQPKAMRVVGTIPAYVPMRETLKVAGTVVARTQVVIAPKVSGRIARLLIDEGDRVGPGQLLAEVDHIELSAQLAQAQAAIASAEAAIAQGKINLLSARSDERRMTLLSDQSAISQQQMDSAQARTALAEQQVVAAQAQLAQARANVRFIQAQLGNYLITAPIAGQITERNVDSGAMAAVGVPLFTLAQTGSLRAAFDIPERSLAKLHPGQPVLVTALAQPNRPVRAKLRDISPVVDPQSRLVHVKADLPPGGIFRPGLSVEGEFVLQEKARALVVPLEAVTVIEGAEQVLVAAHGKATSRRVRSGIRSLTQIEILSGLSPGDRVIVAGQSFIKAGDPVTLELAGSAPLASGSDAPPPPAAPEGSDPAAATRS